jgi:thioredoxin reductase (NADPH)
MGAGGELMNLGPLHDLEEDLAGPDLAGRLLEQVVTAGAELAIAEVTSLRRNDGLWHVGTTEDAHTARAVILAVGLQPGTLGLAQEAEYEGRGLSHCAACDGPLYAGRPVVVVGSDRWARQEAADLLTSASRVTLITQGGTDDAAGRALGGAIDRATVLDGRIVAMDGTPGLTAVTVRLASGEAVTIATEVVFIQTGRRPGLGFAPDALARDDDGRLVADDGGCASLPHLFAAGDARAGSPRTLAAAMRDGRGAASSACASLDP